MKWLLFGLFFVLTGCQKQETPKINPKPVYVKEDLGAFSFLADEVGIEIDGDKISAQGDQTVAENVKVIKSSDKKVIDHFPVEDWGTVGFKKMGDVIRVTLVSNVFEILYSVDKNGRIIRKAQCQFPQVPVPLKEIPLAEDELIKKGYLAKAGDKLSYEFLTSPKAESQDIIKKNPSRFASIIKVLNYMKQNGCEW